MDFAQRLKKIRKEMRLTQDEFAEKLKIHGRHYARYELEKSVPSLGVLKKIADFCEVSTDYLLYGEDKRLSERAKINDLQLLDLFRRVDKLKKGRREQIKWSIEALLEKELLKKEE